MKQHPAGRATHLDSIPNDLAVDIVDSVRSRWRQRLVVSLAIVAAFMESCNLPPRVTTQICREVNAAPGFDDGEVHNVFEILPNLISGSVPKGDAGFAALQRRGVRTILSVDGATPDVATARQFCMRYVHLPIGYQGIDRRRQLEIARAVRDLPSPMYVHCHHGRHRGPAAAASAAVLLGLMTNDEGVEFLKRAGTSDNYPGLYTCVERLRTATRSELEQAASDFPEVAPVPGFVRAMAEAQMAYDDLIEIRDAGWQVPSTHPDLVPLVVGGRLENLMRALQNDPRWEAQSPEFSDLLEASWVAVRELEASLARDLEPHELTRRLGLVRESCTACHAIFRNPRPSRPL